MSKRLLIAIGVHAPDGMEELPGVHAAVTRMADYARRNPTYDDPVVFSDDKDGDEVTAETLREGLTEDLLKNRPRIVVHFCGHGAQINGNEVWYLKEGVEQWSDRVEVMPFVDMLLSYGAKQVCIFSDACQTPGVDAADGTPLLRKGTRGRMEFKTDLFRATIKGKPAFADATDGPLFSKTVLDVLDQDPIPEEALDPQYLAANQTVVSSSSLSRYVEQNLPDIAAEVHKSQYARMAPGLVYDKDDYIIVPPSDDSAEKMATGAGAGGADQPDPALKGSEIGAQGGGLAAFENPHIRYFARYAEDDTSPDFQHRLDQTLSEWRQGFWYEATRAADEALDFGRVVVLARDHKRMGEPPVKLHAPDGSQIDGQPLSAMNSFGGRFFAFDVWEDPHHQYLHPAAVLQIGDHYAPLQLNVTRYLSQLLALRPDLSEDGSDTGFGIEALGWYEVGFSDTQEQSIHPMQALKGLVSGWFGPESLGRIAAELRLRKHSDPLYGIVAAYLYDQAGDTTSIQRMCSYYAMNDQQVPFDIAMLSRLPFEKRADGYVIDVPSIDEDSRAKDLGMPSYVWAGMPAMRALPVSGFAPVLKMGWSRMQTLLDPEGITPKLSAMRRVMTNAPFPTCRGKGHGKELINLMKEFYRHKI